MPQFDDVKAALETEIGYPLDEQIWSDLVGNDRAYVTYARDHKTALDALSDKYARKEKIYEGRGKSRRKSSGTAARREIPADKRLETLGRIAAIEARSSWKVRWFRKRALPGGLLNEREVPDWIRLQAQGESSGPALELHLPVGDAAEFKRMNDTSGKYWNEEDSDELFWLVDMGIEHGVKELEYPLPIAWSDDQCATWLEQLAGSIRRGETRRPSQVVLGERLHFWDAAARTGRSFVYVGRETILSELMRLAEELVTWIPWCAEDAVRFLLTDQPPVLPRARMDANLSQVPAFSRLRLAVDPRMPSKDIAALYESGRAELVRGRDKAMSEKSLALAVFCAERAGASTSWPEKREEWNAELPQWAFPPDLDWYARRFARDARDAYARVVGRPWKDAQKLARREFALVPAIPVDLPSGQGPRGASRGTQGLLERLLGGPLSELPDDEDWPDQPPTEERG